MTQKVELVDRNGNPLNVVNGKLQVNALTGLASGGRVFTQTVTPLGLAIVIYTATALVGALPLWNPTGSGVKVVPLSYTVARVSGTTAFAAFGMMARNGVGSVVATGSQITAFAETTPVNGKLGLVNSISGAGGGETSKIKSSNAGTITVTASVAAEFIRTMGYMQPEIDTTPTGINVIEHDFKGRVEVYPGTMVWIAATKASVALFAQTIEWEEVPI